MRTSLSVYDYLKASLFFQDLLLEIRQRRPSYSTRAWCQKLGLSNSGTISRILKGERPAPVSMTALLAEQHELTEMELVYLQTLCACEDRVPVKTLETLRDVLRQFETR